MPIQTLSCLVTFAGQPLPYVFSASGNVGFDTPYPTCSVMVPVKPATGNEGDSLTVVAGGGNNVSRGTYRVMRFRGSDNPPTVELVGAGSLARAEEVIPFSEYSDKLDDILLFPDPLAPTEPSVLAAGVTSTGKNIIMAMLDAVASIYPEVVYNPDDLDDAGVELGLEADDPYMWRVGQSALDYIREIDRLEGYRTFQVADGTIYRRLITGTPRNALDFTFNAGNVLPGANGDRNDEETRNWVRATGFDWGHGSGPVTYTHEDSNDLQPIGEGHVSPFDHPMIEREDEATDPGTGYSAQQIAEREIENVNKEFVRDSLSTASDAVFGPGQTHMVDLIPLIPVGEPMWAQSLAWRIDTQTGWTQTLGHTGGGLQTAYTPPPV